MPSITLTLSYVVFLLLGLSIVILGVLLSKNDKKKIFVSTVNSIKKEKKVKRKRFDEFLDNNWVVKKTEENIEHYILTSGYNITVRQVTKLRILSILVGILISILLNNILIVVPICVLLYIIPGYFIKRKAKKREILFDSQLLDNFQMFVTDFISTRNVQTSIYNMTKKSTEPLKSEWELLSRSLNSGVPFDKCFISFADRTGSKWSRIFAQVMISYYNQGNDFTDQIMSLTSKMTDEKIAKQENQTEISTMLTLNIIMNAAVPLIYIVNRILEPESSAAFTTTSQGQFIILIITICCMVSLWLGHRVAEW